jgi:uncharacterized protein (TIGR02453 family)
MFQGFSPKTIEFLGGIRFNNEKSWFEAHKSDYQNYLYRPMKELGADVQAKLLERFPKCQLNLKVSRIYRDARRLFGRGPYKDHLWLSLFRWDAENDGDKPVFWFELTPDGWSYGMGFWCARPAMMEKHRARMDRDPKPMLKLARKLDKQDLFTLDGPEYARKKDAPDPKLASWYNKKSLSVGRDLPLTEELYTPELVDTLADGFTFLMPYYEYFSTLWADGLSPGIK